MKEMTREEVLHVAHLARINVSEEDIEKYKVQLKNIMNMVEEINDVKVDSEEILITTSSNQNVYREDEEIDEEVDILKNAPKTNGNYIEIKRFVND